MSKETCGHPTADGTPCQHPATDGDSCWIPAHGGDAESHGRPAAFDDAQTRQRVLVAVGQGLKVGHQASLAGVSPDTLRRALCCVESPRDPSLDPDPCDFCANYAQAHANGAREILNDCRPEFVASASYGYSKKNEVEVSGEGMTIALPESVTDKWQRDKNPE